MVLNGKKRNGGKTSQAAAAAAAAAAVVVAAAAVVEPVPSVWRKIGTKRKKNGGKRSRSNSSRGGGFWSNQSRLPRPTRTQSTPPAQGPNAEAHALGPLL
jgi:hypothetical protein